MGTWPLASLPKGSTGDALPGAIEAHCDAKTGCIAFGFDLADGYQLYNKSAAALAPVANAAWTLYYANTSCALPGARACGRCGEGCGAPPPPPPTLTPPNVFSASQELLEARVNSSMGSSKGADCGTVTSTAIMAPESNVVLAK